MLPFGDNMMHQEFAILEDYQLSIRAVKPNAYIILEHFADNSEEKELSAAGMMIWGIWTTIITKQPWDGIVGQVLISAGFPIVKEAGQIRILLVIWKVMMGTDRI